jgi:rhodanese-related sulfurtransferase
MALTTLKKIDADEAFERVDAGATFIDLRGVPSYLDVHIPGSIALVYEFGPGMAGRARDCIPLSVPLVLIHDEQVNMLHAAASLRGKGFDVVGELDNALNLWADARGQLASTESSQGPRPPEGTIIDVSDPGRRKHDGAIELPIDGLWARREEFTDARELTVLCGRAVRAALAVGILEQAGVKNVRLWRNADQSA